MSFYAPQLTKKEQHQRSDLSHFLRLIDALNSLHWYDYNVPSNVWCIAEIPIVPISMYDISHKSSQVRPSEEDVVKPQNSTAVRMIFAFSPSGLKTGPIFLIRDTMVRQHWFTPLETTPYAQHAGITQFTISQWFPTHGVTLCTNSSTMTKKDMHMVFIELNTQIRMISSSHAKKLVLVPSLFGLGVPGLCDICDKYRFDFARFPKSISPEIDPFEKVLYTKFLSAMYNTERHLDSILYATRHTIHMKLILAIAGYNSITPAEAILSFRACRIWPLKTRFADFHPSWPRFLS